MRFFFGVEVKSCLGCLKSELYCLLSGRVLVSDLIELFILDLFIIVLVVMILY